MINLKNCFCCFCKVKCISKNIYETLKKDKFKTLKKILNTIALMLCCLRISQVILSKYIYSILSILHISFSPLINYYLASVFVFIVSMLLPIILGSKICNVNIKSIFSIPKIKLGNFLSLAFLSLAICMLSSIISNIIYIISEKFSHPLSNSKIYYDGSIISAMMLLLSSCILPAIFEELVFRAFVLNSLKQYGNLLAIVISSLLFALVHSTALQLPFAFVCGLSLGFIALKTGSVLSSVLIHFLINFRSVAAVIISYNFSEAYSNVFLNASLLLFLLLGFVSFCFLQRKNLLRLNPCDSSISLKAFIATCFSSPVFILSFLYLCVSTFSVV